MPLNLQLPARARRFSPVLGLICLPALAGCALEPFSEDGSAKQAASFLRVASPVGEPQEFVRQQRPAEKPEFIPVGVTPPSRPVAPRAADGVSALEAELDGQRRASRSFATRPAPRSTYDGSRPPRVQPPPKELTPE